MSFSQQQKRQLNKGSNRLIPLLTYGLGCDSGAPAIKAKQFISDRDKLPSLNKGDSLPLSCRQSLADQTRPQFLLELLLESDLLILAEHSLHRT